MLRHEPTSSVSADGESGPNYWLGYSSADQGQTNTPHPCVQQKRSRKNQPESIRAIQKKQELAKKKLETIKQR